VILLDRSVDLLTPLITQASYIGMLDEVFGIEFNKINIKRSLAFPLLPDQTPSEKQEEMMRFPLVGNVFDKIKDLDSSSLAAKFRETLRQIQEGGKVDPKDMKSIRRASELVEVKKQIEPHINIASHLSTRLLQRKFKRLLELEQVIPYPKQGNTRRIRFGRFSISSGGNDCETRRSNGNIKTG